MKPLLLIMNPRRIPECLDAIRALKIDKVWLTAMWERELEAPIAKLVEERDDYTHFVIISDDTIPTQDALDLVLAAAEQTDVAAGYCNLDAIRPYVSLCASPFDPALGSVHEAYDWITREDVEGSGPIGSLMEVFHQGFAFTCMPRAMWQRFPFKVFGEHPRGFASDYVLSLRLQQADVPIHAVRGAFMPHLKPDITRYDRTPGHELLMGAIPAAVQWDLAGRRP